MARRQINKLTVAQCKAAKATGKPYRLHDGRGLMLNVSPSGSKSWVERLVIQGVRREMGLGSFEHITLAEAREEGYRRTIVARKGGDPRPKRTKPALTFKEAQVSALAEKAKAWKPDSRGGNDWKATMEKYVLPKLGARPVSDIEAPDIRKVLLPIAEDGKHVQAKTIGRRIGMVLDWASIEGHRKIGNPIAAVISSLPKRKTQIEHHKALHFSEVSEALAKVDATRASEGIKLALRFMVLTSARTAEVRDAKWSEIDFNRRLWRVPAPKMKAERKHDVPLSSAAFDVLREAAKMKGTGNHIFVGRSGSKIGPSAIRRTMQAGAKLDATPHGMRSAFKEWCRNQGIDDELSELAIAHGVGSATKSAYARSELTEMRRPIMEDWAAYLGSPS